MSSSASFGIVDFIVFSGFMVASMIVGLYYAIKDRKKESMDNYYFGEKKMSPLPVGLSMAVTFISAISLIAYPAEVYSFGNVIVWFVFDSIIPAIFACLFYVPLFMRLKASSIFEYLERRFDRRIRKVASFIATCQMMFYMAVAIYAPSLALSAVTPLKLDLTVIFTSLLCTIYTSLGGMKAVIWTDTLQAFIILTGCLTAIVKSLIVVGGFENVWNALERGGRNNAFIFNPDPTIRVTFFTIILGGAIGGVQLQQALVQRWLSCGTIKKARLSTIIALIPTIVVILICVMNGLVMYAYYENCDPLKSGKIKKIDQMMPYMVLDIFQNLPGAAGLFIAAAFSGTLSTVSSGINSASALIMEDFVLPYRPTLNQSKQVKISKCLVFFLGMLSIGLALLVGNIDRTIMQIAHTLTAMLVGPLTGVFLLGMFLPWANAKGAVVGQIFGTAFIGWIAFGGLLYGKHANTSLPTSIQGCTATNSSDLSNSSQLFTTTALAISSSSTLSTTLYSVSFLYYSAISLITTVSSGLVGSLLTGANKPSKADPLLFVPIISNPIFPSRLREFFRLGVPYLKGKEKPIEPLTEMKLIS